MITSPLRLVNRLFDFFIHLGKHHGQNITLAYRLTADHDVIFDRELVQNPHNENPGRLAQRIHDLAPRNDRRFCLDFWLRLRFDSWPRLHHLILMDGVAIFIDA